VLVAIEAEVDYIIRMLSRFQKEDFRSFDVKPGPVDAFVKWKDDFMSRTIWTEECRSWYKAGSVHGKVAALWPGPTLHYLEALRDVRWEDWALEYEAGSNPWSFLGNGHSTAEKRTGDLSYYIRNYDDAPVDPCLKPSSWTREQEVEVLPHGIVPDVNGLEGDSSSQQVQAQAKL
jgi:hypothetical protein